MKLGFAKNYPLGDSKEEAKDRSILNESMGNVIQGLLAERRNPNVKATITQGSVEHRFEIALQLVQLGIYVQPFLYDDKDVSRFKEWLSKDDSRNELYKKYTGFNNKIKEKFEEAAEMTSTSSFKK